MRPADYLAIATALSTANAKATVDLLMQTVTAQQARRMVYEAHVPTSVDEACQLYLTEGQIDAALRFYFNHQID